MTSPTPQSWSPQSQQATRQAIDDLPITPDVFLHFKNSDGRYAVISLSDLARDALVLHLKNSEQQLAYDNVDALLDAGWVID